MVFAGLKIMAPTDSFLDLNAWLLGSGDTGQGLGGLDLLGERGGLIKGSVSPEVSFRVSNAQTRGGRARKKHLYRGKHYGASLYLTGC